MVPVFQAHERWLFVSALKFPCHICVFSTINCCVIDGQSFMDCVPKLWKISADWSTWVWTFKTHTPIVYCCVWVLVIINWLWLIKYKWIRCLCVVGARLCACCFADKQGKSELLKTKRPSSISALDILIMKQDKWKYTLEYTNTHTLIQRSCATITFERVLIC